MSLRPTGKLVRAEWINLIKSMITQPDLGYLGLGLSLAIGILKGGW